MRLRITGFGAYLGDSAGPCCGQWHKTLKAANRCASSAARRKGVYYDGLLMIRGIDSSGAPRMVWATEVWMPSDPEILKVGDIVRLEEGGE
jgi:hypothetical protein